MQHLRNKLPKITRKKTGYAFVMKLYYSPHYVRPWIGSHLTKYVNIFPNYVLKSSFSNMQLLKVKRITNQHYLLIFLGYIFNFKYIPSNNVSNRQKSLNHKITTIKRSSMITLSEFRYWFTQKADVMGWKSTTKKRTLKIGSMYFW